MKIGYTPGTGWPGLLPGTWGIPRRHLYEGGMPHPKDYEGFDAVILTNASGSVTGNCQPGNVYWIRDHINLTGRSPLFGADHQSGFGIYEQQEPAGRGVVYAQVGGPEYETPAEAGMLARFGAHVVGMSTALEAVAARRAGCRVWALTFVANWSGQPSDHEEVLAAAAKAAPQMAERLERLMEKIK